MWGGLCEYGDKDLHMRKLDWAGEEGGGVTLLHTREVGSCRHDHLLYSNRKQT